MLCMCVLVLVLCGLLFLIDRWFSIGIWDWWKICVEFSVVFFGVFWKLLLMYMFLVCVWWKLGCGGLVVLMLLVKICVVV